MVMKIQILVFRTVCGKIPTFQWIMEHLYYEEDGSIVFRNVGKLTHHYANDCSLIYCLL